MFMQTRDVLCRVPSHVSCLIQLFAVDTECHSTMMYCLSNIIDITYTDSQLTGCSFSAEKV